MFSQVYKVGNLPQIIPACEAENPGGQGNSVISTMTSENVVMPCSRARLGRWETLKSSLEACQCLHDNNRSPGTWGRSGEKGYGSCAVDQETEQGVQKMGVWAYVWKVVSLFHPPPSVESTCNPTSVTLRDHPEKKISVIIRSKEEQNREPRIWS